MSIEVLNKITAMPEETPVINVSMSNAIYRGPKGDKGDKGDDGFIQFEELTPEQKEELRGPQGIQGPKGDRGDKGDPGVYIGAETPEGDVNVWIDPTGDPIDLPSGGGSDIEYIRLPLYKSDLDEETINKIIEYCQYYKDNNKINTNIKWYIQSTDKMICWATSAEVSSYSNYITMKLILLDMGGSARNLYCKIVNNEIDSYYVAELNPYTAPGWHYASNSWSGSSCPIHFPSPLIKLVCLKYSEYFVIELASPSGNDLQENALEYVCVYDSGAVVRVSISGTTCSLDDSNISIIGYYYWGVY